MGDIAIQVENVSKLYHIGKRQKYKTARESLMNALSLPARLLRGRRDDPDTELWALKDVSFTVPRGEVVGIIGRNGAGKSTLLKVLSRITEPTSGRITLNGRVGSLLEVGTGFHPELTGRENIFLNGAILGMRRAEIQRNFDAIVDFSEIAKFLDTPVKHYSSGMYMRLAFAVAAHLEPEILIVDEVLAVGDAAFQKKCLGKMQDVAGQGRTVLFVSHNLAAVSELCRRGIVLSAGQKIREGTATEAVSAYLADVPNEQLTSADVSMRARHATLGTRARVEMVRAVPTEGAGFKWWEPPRFEVTVRAVSSVEQPVFGVGIEAPDGTRISTVESTAAEGPRSLEPGTATTMRITFHDIGLQPGTYGLAVGLRSGLQDLDYVDGAIRFEVTPARAGTGEVYAGRAGFGPVCANGQWQCVETN
jgi:lipopolysaccharide transport system ATP-binding protein